MRLYSKSNKQFILFGEHKIAKEERRLTFGKICTRVIHSQFMYKQLCLSQYYHHIIVFAHVFVFAYIYSVYYDVNENKIPWHPFKVVIENLHHKPQNTWPRPISEIWLMLKHFVSVSKSRPINIGYWIPRHAISLSNILSDFDSYLASANRSWNSLYAFAEKLDQDLCILPQHMYLKQTLRPKRLCKHR